MLFRTDVKKKKKNIDTMQNFPKYGLWNPTEFSAMTDLMKGKMISWSNKDGKYQGKQG